MSSLRIAFAKGCRGGGGGGGGGGAGGRERRRRRTRKVEGLFIKAYYNIRDGEPRTATSTFTQLLRNSVSSHDRAQIIL